MGSARSGEQGGSYSGQIYSSWLDINAITGTEVQGIVVEQISEVTDSTIYLLNV